MQKFINVTIQDAQDQRVTRQAAQERMTISHALEQHAQDASNSFVMSRLLIVLVTIS